MREWLTFLSEQAIVLIDAVALIVIVIGTLEVLVTIVRALLRTMSNYSLRAAWLAYARWLVAALTFQLAADIIETSISTSWETIARVGAIAVIRTFLNYFLDRDLVEMRERQQASRPPAAPEPDRTRDA